MLYDNVLNSTTKLYKFAIKLFGQHPKINILNPIALFILINHSCIISTHHITNIITVKCVQIRTRKNSVFGHFSRNIYRGCNRKTSKYFRMAWWNFHLKLISWTQSIIQLVLEHFCPKLHFWHEPWDSRVTKSGYVTRRHTLRTRKLVK